MTTNVDFLYNLASCSPFQRAELDTGFIERHRREIFHQQPDDLERALPLAALYLVLARSEAARRASHDNRDPWSPWHLASGWRLNEPHLHHFQLVVQEQQLAIAVEQQGIGAARRYVIRHGDREICARGELDGQQLSADVEGHRLQATVAEHDGRFSLYSGDCAVQFSLLKPDLGETDQGPDANSLLAPMNGTVVAVLVEAGSRVTAGDPLLIMEAMKMEHSIRAPADGVVSRFYYQAGELVDGGCQLLEFDADD